MMNMKRKVTVFLTSLILFVCGVSFTGCRPSAAGEVQINKTQTQLSVANYDGGVGSEWFYAMIKGFEEKYADVEFEPGKKGVQIIPDASKADHISQISSDTYNVIFAESVDVNGLIASGSILEITDIVQAEGEDGKTIESKLSDEQKAMLSVYGGKYYALPHYEYYPGLTYDRELFNDESLYIAEGGGYTDLNGDRSAGPDGKKGTYDDGLPATVEQFMALCDHIANDTQAVPFIYGMMQYTDVILEGLTVSLQSEDEFMLNFDFDSTKGGTLEGADTVKMDVITGWNGTTPIVEKKEITSSTGYLTSQNAQKYYALQTLETIMKNQDSYMSKETSSTTSHTEAQRLFILSNLKRNEPVAMLIEGSFWYNEAKTSKALSDSVSQYGQRAKNRDFAWMPLPTAVDGEVNESNGRPFKLVDEANSYAVINANIANDPVKVRLAKLFLQYCYTDANLELFTASTGCFKGLDYDVSEETYNGMDNFYRSIAEIRKANGVIRPLSSNPVYTNNQNSFMFMRTYYFTTSKYATAGSVFKGRTATAKDFFDAMSIKQSAWQEQYSQYYND